MSLDVLILAAGLGTRMKSSLPKVLHPVGGKPLVTYSVEMAAALSQRPPVLVIGHGGEQVRAVLGDSARYVLQAEQLGTGHAVLQARDLLRGQSDRVIVCYADMPLLRPETLAALESAQQVHDGPITMLGHETETPRGFGRLVLDDRGQVEAIVEEAVATPEQKAIRLVNVGVYCFEASFLWESLDRIQVSPRGEYYLTDLVEIARRDGRSVKAIYAEDADELIGINTRVDLADAEAALRRRINRAHMLAGVTLIDPAATYIEPGVQIGPDTVILPNTILRGRTLIGAACRIGPNTQISDSQIGDRCEIECSTLEQATLEEGVDVGPYAHLRKGAYLEAGVHMGNFGEVKNSRLRRGVKMGHFSYIGDGDIGENSNIGAGSITCNYDGSNKHKTIVGRDVFIGSDTMLVAPLTLGDGARTGAGAVVTKDVAPGELVVGVPARPLHRPKPEEES